ncbi:unnamed protein product [Brassica rapa subsp. trilocularis]
MKRETWREFLVCFHDRLQHIPSSFSFSFFLVSAKSMIKFKIITSSSKTDLGLVLLLLWLIFTMQHRFDMCWLSTPTKKG